MSLLQMSIAGAVIILAITVIRALAIHRVYMDLLHKIKRRLQMQEKSLLSLLIPIQHIFILLQVAQNLITGR